MATISDPTEPEAPVAPTVSGAIPGGWAPANPAPLGLMGFGITTLILSIMNANLVSFANDLPVVLGVALAYGGIAQLIAGIWEFRTGNTFGAVVFCSYGSFWISFFFLAQFELGNVGGGVGGVNAGLGLYLWAFAILTGILFLCTFTADRTIQAIFLFLALTLVFLGIGNSGGSASMIHVGGYLGIITSALALYTAAAAIMTFMYGREVLPVGHPTPHN
jgi:succinate-acetate transporter protein